MPTPPSEYRYPCENCGASLEFSPGQQSLACPYCGHEQHIGPGPARAPGRQAGQGPWGDRAILNDPSTGRALQWDSGHKSQLRELPLEDDIVVALLRGDNDLGQLHIMARHYEKAEWEEFSAMAQKIGIPEQDVAKLYRQALEWAQGLFVLLS